MGKKILTLDSLGIIVQGVYNKMKEKLEERFKTLEQMIKEMGQKAAQIAIEAITKELDGKIKAALADPTKFKPLVEAIARDPEACRILEEGCHKAAMEAKNKAQAHRRDKIAQVVIETYRAPGKSDLTQSDVETLVSQIDAEGIVHGKRENDFYKEITPFLQDQDVKMREAIKPMVTAKTDQPTVDNYARLLVLEGLGSDDPTLIRARLKKESDIKLKK